MTVLVIVNILCSGLTVLGQELMVRQREDGIGITEEGREVLFYRKSAADASGAFARAHYIHPLFSLRGSVLTEDFPKDHPHHHGVFWAWHQIMRRGAHVADGWTAEQISWEVVQAGLQEGGTSVTIDSEVRWTVMEGNRAEPLVEEFTSIIIHRSEKHYRFIDFEIRLRALVDSVAIGGSDDPKGYGGFSIRLTLPPDISFQSATGEVAAQELSLQAGPWMDFRGSFDGPENPEAGIAIFCHPANPGFPESWILRKQKSMQNAAFPGRIPIALPRSGITLRYRVVIHDEAVDRRAISRLFKTYTKGGR